MNEVTKIDHEEGQSSPENPYNSILQIAIRDGAPLEQLEKWMQLKRENDAYEAMKEYYKAFAAFKREEISIPKDRNNAAFKSPQYPKGAPYTSLGKLLEIVAPYLGKHGLSHHFIPTQGDGMLTVECVLRHDLGHSESASMTGPPDTSGGNSKNPIQQIKSTFTYLRSATFEAVTGLAGTDASLDDDGNSAGGVQYINTDQQTEIKDLVKEIYDPEPERFWSYMKVKGAEEILAKDYNKAITALKAAEKAKNAKVQK